VEVLRGRRESWPDGPGGHTCSGAAGEVPAVEKIRGYGLSAVSGWETAGPNAIPLLMGMARVEV
jgi:hypothetical protein